MKFVEYQGNLVKKCEYQVLVLLERNRRPTEGFVKMLSEKMIKIAQRKTRPVKGQPK